MRRASTFQKVLLDKKRREEGRGLLTVSNHTTAIDDPGAVATLIGWNQCLRPELMRWTPCATDRCFKNTWTAGILRKGKVVPVQRGAGIMQGWMTSMLAKLDEGEWVHFFPEGTRSRVAGKMGKVRAGVGRLALDASLPPVVVPFYHYGMEQVLPRGTKVPLPLTAGKDMAIFVGEPVPLDDVWAEYRAEMEAEGFSVLVASRELEAMRGARLPVRGAEGERRSGGGEGKLSAVAAGQGAAGIDVSASSSELVLAHPSSDPPLLSCHLSYSLPVSDKELKIRNRHYERAAERIKEHLLMLENEANEWAGGRQ